MHYPDPKLRIQNLPNSESRYPIKNSADFTVEVTEMNGEKKKYSLEELAKIVPTHLFEGVVSPEIKDDKLTIVTHQKLDESYSNKILIKTDRDSFVVIPNYLIEKAREKEKNLRIEKEKKYEQVVISNPALWGGNVNAISTGEGGYKKILIFAPNNLRTVMLEIVDDTGVASTIRRPRALETNSSQQDLSINPPPNTIRTIKVVKTDITPRI